VFYETVNEVVACLKHLTYFARDNKCESLSKAQCKVRKQIFSWYRTIWLCCFEH